MRISRSSGAARFDAPAPLFGRVLCAVSLAPSARRVIEWAAALAALDDAEVRLLHTMAGAAGGDEGELLLGQMFGLARKLPQRVRLSAAICAGTAHVEIARHASVMRAGLIAVGLHSEDGSLSELTRRLLTAPPCPILAVNGERTGDLGPPARVRQLACLIGEPTASAEAIRYAAAIGRKSGARVAVIDLTRWTGAAADLRIRMAGNRPIDFVVTTASGDAESVAAVAGWSGSPVLVVPAPS